MNALTTVQEAQLTKRAQQGDHAAFSELVQAIEARLFRVAMQICRNQQEAEDALQDGLLKAYEKLASFHGESRFSTWATRIVINECLMRLRSHNQYAFTSIDEPAGDDGDMPLDLRAWDETPEQRYSRSQLREILNEALSGLAEDYRVVVLLRDVEGLTNEEAAEELGITVAAVKSRLLRGRLALRARLTRHFMRKSRAATPQPAAVQPAASRNTAKSRARKMQDDFSPARIFASLVPLATVAVVE